jgi:hypothetical protein
MKQDKMKTKVCARVDNSTQKKRCSNQNGKINDEENNIGIPFFFYNGIPFFCETEENII